MQALVMNRPELEGLNLSLTKLNAHRASIQISGRAADMARHRALLSRLGPIWMGMNDGANVGDGLCDTLGVMAPKLLLLLRVKTAVLHANTMILRDLSHAATSMLPQLRLRVQGRAYNTHRC